MSRAPFTSFQFTLALRRGSLNWPRTLAWDWANIMLIKFHQISRIIIVASIVIPKNIEVCKIPLKWWSFTFNYPWRVSIQKKQKNPKVSIETTPSACMSAFSYRSSPKLERAAPTCQRIQGDVTAISTKKFEGVSNVSSVLLVQCSKL